MAGCGMTMTTTARDLVHQTYSPHVAVLCSRAAESLCERNNLKFIQLLQPFTSLTTELSWQEPNGQHVIPRSLRITPIDIASWKPSESDVQRNKKILNNVVTQSLPPLFSLTSDSHSGQLKVHKLGGRVSEYTVEVPATTPWFESWRETFLELHSEQQQSQHEFLHHFIACILVISSSEGKNSEDLANIVGKLSKLQQQHQYEWPQTWVLTSVLKFYLILHESSSEEDSNSAETMYQSLRTTYGANFCYMLKLNSGPASEIGQPQIPDPWAHFVKQELQRSDATVVMNVSNSFEETEPVIQSSDVMHPLSPESEFSPAMEPQNGGIFSESQEGDHVRGKYLILEDLQNIQVAINEFLGKALLPYIERQAKVLNESILNRRGMSKSFFSATKRLFGTAVKPTTSVVYAIESPEMMCRKLADIYFLFGHYSGAYQLYHQMKKDFSADGAWLYYASSLEMAAVSHFMMTQTDPPMAITRSFPIHYVNEAIGHYIDNCRMNDAATRCAIICCECLKQMDNYGEAAALFIRMTSEECDLRSALMLEQAAYSFLRLNSPRKYALHSVLAGHRYAKAGLKTHSLNCYLQACQVYSGKGWRFAEDHVHFTIARHQSSLQLYEGISQHLKFLLTTPTPQPSQQIQIFYKEFLTIMARIFEEDKNPQDFFVPKVIVSDVLIRIAISGLHTGEISNLNTQEDVTQSNWDVLEEQVVKECIDSSVIHFKPSKLLFHRGTDNTVHPTVPCNETFYVEIPLHNPLSIEVSLRNIGLGFDQNSSISCSVIEKLHMLPGDTKIVRFEVTSMSVGMIAFERIMYELEFGILRVPFQQKIVMQGPRLNSSAAERCGRSYAKDLRNNINIVHKMPLLQAKVEDLPPSLFQAQQTKFNLVLQDQSRENDQRKRISRVIVATEKMSESLEIYSKHDPVEGLELESVRNNYCSMKLVLDGSSSIRIPCLFKVPQNGDVALLNILILYQIQSFEPGTTGRLYRAIKISIKVPLVTCLSLEYSTLKLIDAVTSMGLLKVHNLTQNGTVSLKDLQFNPSEINIEEMNIASVKLENTNNNNSISVGPTESRNIIMKVRDAGNISEKHRVISLGVGWQIEQSSGNESEEETFKASGYYKLGLGDNHFSIEKSPLVFQVKHNNKSTHDFNSSPCFICPVEIFVHSRIAGRVTLRMDKVRQNELELGMQSLQASSQELFFVGQTSWTVEMEPVKSKKLDYKVAVTRPGIYNVAPVITVKHGESDTHQTYTLHSPLIVGQSSVA